MRAEILVDAAGFWPRLRDDLLQARERVRVQALTLEGDEAGRALAGALRRSAAADRKILVDEYTRHVISDRFLHTWAARRDRALQREVAATRSMFVDLEAAGVAVRFTNPMGPLLLRYPARNHKKLVLVDDIAYLGGINFSDHNFAWHDFMLRIDDAAVADRLASDFEVSWGGSHAQWSASFDGLDLFSLDGRTNAEGFRVVLFAMERARQSILIESPYLTRPFLAPLRRAAARGVDVALIAPARNNKRVMDAYIRRETRRAGIRLHLDSGRMIHLKAMLIDDEDLWIGSANLDFVSYRCEQELLCRIRDPRLVAEFRRRVLEPDRARAPLFEGGGTGPAGWLRSRQIGAADLLLAGLLRVTAHHRPPRAAPGPPVRSDGD